MWGIVAQKVVSHNDHFKRNFYNQYDQRLITGTPISVGTAGQRMFFSDVSGVIRHSAIGAGATSAYPALH
jgi:hypothetical protein